MGWMATEQASYARQNHAQGSNPQERSEKFTGRATSTRFAKDVCEKQGGGAALDQGDHPL